MRKSTGNGTFPSTNLLAARAPRRGRCGRHQCSRYAAGGTSRPDPHPSVAFRGDGRNGRRHHHHGGGDGRLLRAGRLLREGGRRAAQGRPVARACGGGPRAAGPCGPEAVRFGASEARAAHGHPADGRGSRRGCGRSWTPGTPMRQRRAPIACKPPYGVRDIAPRSLNRMSMPTETRKGNCRSSGHPLETTAAGR